MCNMKNKSCVGPSSLGSELCSGHTIIWAACQFIVPLENTNTFLRPGKYKYYILDANTFLRPIKYKQTFNRKEPMPCSTHDHKYFQT